MTPSTSVIYILYFYAPRVKKELHNDFFIFLKLTPEYLFRLKSDSRLGVDFFLHFPYKIVNIGRAGFVVVYYKARMLLGYLRAAYG